MLVAREAERADPPRAAPQAVRRYLSFARLPDPALEVVRRVLDEDADFRASVTAAVDEERIGRAGWLFVTRPDGWQQEVEALVQKASAEELAAKEDRAERGAQRRLAGAEAAAARAEASTRAALDEARQAKAELDAERAASAPLREALAVARTELDEVRASRSATIARLKEAEAALAARTAETRALRHELRMAQAELTQAEPGGAPSRADPGPADPVPVDRRDAGPPGVTRRARWLEPPRRPRRCRSPSPTRPDSSTSTRHRRRQPARSRRRQDGPDRCGRGGAPPPSRRRSSTTAPRRRSTSCACPAPSSSSTGTTSPTPSGGRTRRPSSGPACSTPARELHARCGIDVEVVFDGDRETASAGTLPRSGVRYRFTRRGRRGRRRAARPGRRGADRTHGARGVVGPTGPRRCPPAGRQRARRPPAARRPPPLRSRFEAPTAPNPDTPPGHAPVMGDKVLVIDCAECVLEGTAACVGLRRDVPRRPGAGGGGRHRRRRGPGARRPSPGRPASPPSSGTAGDAGDLGPFAPIGGRDGTVRTFPERREETIAAVGDAECRSSTWWGSPPTIAH